MKKTIALATLALALAVGTLSPAQTTTHSKTSVTNGVPLKDDLFDGTEQFAKNATDVTEITMDPETLGMVGGKNKAKAGNMVLNVIRTYEYDKPGMYKIEDVEAFRNKLNTGAWHCSVHTRSLKTGESTDICSKQRTDDLDEKAIITVEPKELTFIHTISKKNGDEGVSELELLDRPDVGSMAALAPALGADMQMAIARMNTVDSAALQEQLRTTMKTLDTPEMQQRLNEAMKLSTQDADENAGTPDVPEAPNVPPPPPSVPAQPKQPK